MSQPALAIDALRTEFRLGEAWRAAVDGVSFTLAEQETLALVGESGCGKSVIALSIIGLPPPLSSRISGQVRSAGIEMVGLPRPELERPVRTAPRWRRLSSPAHVDTTRCSRAHCATEFVLLEKKPCAAARC